MRIADGDYWVDDCGAWNHVALGELCPMFSNTNHRSRQRLDLAFRHLGMVRVSKRPETVAVQWDVAKACEESLDSACALLGELVGVKRAKLRFYFGGWTHEIFNSVREACIRLTELRKYRGVTPFPDVRFKPIAEAAIEDTATPSIRLTRKLLASNGNRMDSDLCNRLADENLTDRILLFQEEDEGAWLSYRYIGYRSLYSQVFGSGVLRDQIGKSGATNPSRNRLGYGLARSYPQVIASGEARVDQVFAPVKHDNEDGYWLSYQRILAPCSTRDGRRVLLVLADHTEESLIAV